MEKRLLTVLAIVAALVFVEGGAVLAQTNNIDLANLVVINAQRLVTDSRTEVERSRPLPPPLPALPVPLVMTDRGMVQAPNPRPLDSFPVARTQPLAKPQQAAKPIPAIKTPPVVTEKGMVQAPNPRPTADFPVAKPQQKTPAIEISRQERPEQRPAVGVAINKTEIKVIVNPPAFESGEDKKIATKIRPGEVLLMERKYGIWKAETKKTNEIPPGYTLREGKESGS
jgi:hypothetical protein